MPTDPQEYLSVMKSGPNSKISQVDQERMQRIGICAEPYSITVNATTTEYILHLKPQLTGTGVGIARRIIPRNSVDGRPSDSEEFLFGVIEQMKKELGWRGISVKKAYIDGEMERRKKILAEKVGHEVSKLEASRLALDEETSSRPPSLPDNKARPQCPMHGNLLEPREVGVLVCPIDGCTVEMRKKKSGAAFERRGDTVPAPVDLKPEQKTGEFIPPPPPIPSQISYAGISYIAQFDSSVTDAPVELANRPGWPGHFILKQGDQIIYLNDQCGAEVHVYRDRGGLTEATVKIHVRPVGPGTDIVNW